jgi:hypothetical protein
MGTLNFEYYKNAKIKYGKESDWIKTFDPFKLDQYLEFISNHYSKILESAKNGNESNFYLIFQFFTYSNKITPEIEKDKQDFFKKYENNS